MIPRPRTVARSTRWVEAFSRRRSLHPGAVYAIGGFGVAVTGLHFASMGLFLYSKIWWWDVLVHALSGFGVAATATAGPRPRNWTHCWYTHGTIGRCAGSATTT